MAQPDLLFQAAPLQDFRQSLHKLLNTGDEGHNSVGHIAFSTFYCRLWMLEMCRKEHLQHPESNTAHAGTMTVGTVPQHKLYGWMVFQQ